MKKSDSFVNDSEMIESVIVNDSLLSKEAFTDEKLCNSVILSEEEEVESEGKEDNGMNEGEGEFRLENRGKERNGKKGSRRRKNSCLENMKKLDCISKVELVADSRRRKNRKDTKLLHYY